MKFYEKLIISLVVFVGVCIATAFIIGTFVKTVNKAEDNNSIILENINLF